MIQHHNGERRLLVGFNVRGADLGHAGRAGAEAGRGTEVPAARLSHRVGRPVRDAQLLAKDRLVLVIPTVLLVIIGLLWLLFLKLRPALMLFSHVPFACTGGWWRWRCGACRCRSRRRLGLSRCRESRS
jgi:cobalt-zinc-cadmium resistance protein CzcA